MMTPAAIAEQLALAVRHHQGGRLQRAEIAYRQILAVDPNQADAIHLLGVIAHQSGKHEIAIKYIRRAIGLAGSQAAFHCNLGAAHYALGRIPEAATCYRRALELMPDNAEAHNNLGLALHDLGRLDEAAAGFRRALALRPAYAPPHYNLGTYYEQIGDFERARRSWREALRHDPSHAKALASLATQLRASLPADEFATLARRASSSEGSVAERASLHFGMAHVLDGREDYEGAASHLVHANSLSLVDHRAHGHSYDLQAHDRFVTTTANTYSPSHFERVRGWGADSTRPVFVFGLPRSGTTLTEQILAGHSQVFGAGELPLTGIAFKSLPQLTRLRAAPLECVAALDQQAVGAAARAHLDRFEAIDNQTVRIVDKLPDNYLHLGLLMTLFPKATFIHCRRDLRDIAVSCWMTNFRQTYWSNDMSHIAARIRAHEHLLEHWRRALPVPILEVDYETTVADLEGSARRLINFCGLEWEPQCLSYHTRRDPVRTASTVQVRQPVYQNSVGRWKNYADHLAPLFAALGAGSP
jgi:Tfp pilus assembly protein PilF